MDAAVGFAKPSEQSFKLREGTDAYAFSRFLCTMFNVTPIKGMMTVIYEFPWMKRPLQNYDIYFTNEELTDDQSAIEYRDVFRPEDLPGKACRRG